MATRTWTLKIRGDSSDAVRAVDKVERRFKTLDIDKSFGSKLSRLSARFQGFASNMAATGRRIARGMAVGIGAGVVALGALAVKASEAASDLNESVNAVNVVFGRASKTIRNFGRTSAQSIGLSTAAFQQMATPVGAALRNAGLNADQAADSTVRLSRRAADMASVFNTDVSESMTAIQAALRGEADPIERFGVNMSAAAVQAEALALGINESWNEMSQQDKMMARLSLFFAQTDRVAGDFANTSGEVANQERIASAQAENLMARLGQLVIPIKAGLIQGITNLAGLLGRLGQAFMAAFQGEGITSTGLFGAVERAGVAARAAWPHIQRIGEAVKNFGLRVGEFFKRNPKVLFAVLATVVGGVLLAAVVALGAALISVLSPFIAVVAVLAVVAGAVTYAYTRWSWFRTAVDAVVSWFSDTAWPAIQAFVGVVVGGFQDVADWARRIWPQVSEAVTHVINVIRMVIGVFVVVALALWDRFGSTILDFARRTWGAIWQVISGFLTIIRGIIQTVLAVINGDWGKAWDGIKMIIGGVWQIIQGVIDSALAHIRLVIGIAFNAVWAFVQMVWNGILMAITFVWGLILGVIRMNLAILTAALALGWNIIWTTVTTIWNAIWTSITFVWGLIVGSIRSQIDAVKFIISNGMKAISDIWGFIWGGMGSALSAIWEGIKAGVTGGVNAVIDVINWFIRLLNNIPGVDIGEIGKVGGGGRGGRARGAGGTERGLAYARGGITDGPQYLVGEGNRAFPEAVIATDPKYRQRNLGLLSWAADRMGVPMGFERGGIPGFQIGGIIETLAGPIGTAIGQKAIDLGQELASGVGMRALNEGRDIVKGMVDRIPGPFGYVRDMGRGVVDKMHEHAKGIIEAMEASGGGPGANAGYGGGGVERWRGTALQALAMTGSPASWIGSLLRRMNQESGGNPTAINLTDINAQRGDPSMGLMQNIRSAYASRIAGFPSLRGTSPFHPLGSIVASIVYTKGRYGSGPAGWDRPGGYKHGGILGFGNGGVLPEDVMGVGASGQRYKFHQAERITSAPQAGSDGGLRLVVEGDIVIHANDREGGRQAAKGYVGYLAERGIIVDAKIA